jgi:transcriptional regulator with GAF, ATPase, and Fis domain
VVQNKEIERVGGTETVSVDVRIIAATHRNLEEMVADDSFRRDLWFRLNVFPIRIPPLRDRLNDIQALVYYFIEKKSVRMNIKKDFQPAPGALESLLRYSWPGNVRELENMVERSLIQANAQQSGRYLYFDVMDKSAARSEPTVEADMMTLDQAAVRQMEKALTAAKGKIEGPGGAAELLDIHPATLRARMRKLGVRFGRSRYSC